jgi:mRNA interferase RelE/StbE
VSYEVEIAPAAKRQIKKFPHDVQQKVVAKDESAIALFPKTL